MRALTAGMIVAMLALPASAQVTGTRSLPGSCPGSAEIAVALDLSVDEPAAPNGVIVIERLPAGWELLSATPAEDSFDPATGEIRWVFFGAAVTDDGMDVRYTARAPQQAAGTQPFAGTLRFNDGSGNPREVALQGGDSCAASGTGGPPLSAMRSLPGTCNAGTKVQVELDLEVEEDQAPNGVIVVEMLPDGWTLADADPAADSFDPATGEARWVFFGTAVDDSSMDIRYTATAPSDTRAAQVFAGTLRYNDAGGVAQELTIEGQSVCRAQSAPSNPGDQSNAGGGSGGGGCAITTPPGGSGVALWLLLLPVALLAARRGRARGRTLVATGMLTALAAGSPAAAQTHPADTDRDGRITDFELLAYIDRWADGAVSDFDLLDAIDIWAGGGPIGPTPTHTRRPEVPTPTHTPTYTPTYTPTRTPTRPPSTVGMTWTIVDACADGDGIQFRLFDKDNNLVWPDNSRVYVIDPGRSAQLTIACRPGAKICYGATSRRFPDSGYWGVGINGDRGCADCCYTCAPVTLPARNLIC